LKKLLLFIPFLIFSATLLAQDMYKDNRVTYLSIFGGPSKYLGDIGNQNNSFWRQYSIRQGTWMAGGSIKRVYARKFAWQLQGTFGNLAGADREVTFKDKTDSNYQLFERNLDFRTKISEASLMFEIYPFMFLNKKYKLYKFPVQPFFTGGGAIFSYNPQGSYYDDVYKATIWYDLKPLHTEGQGFAAYPNRPEYSLTQYAVPYGGGLNMYLGPRNYIAIGITGRKLFTDYLDDVSTTYIDKKYFDTYITNTDDVDVAKQLSDKSILINPFTNNTDGAQRGNYNKYDAYFTYYIKIGFKIGGKKKKQAEYYKYDDNEICN
jgi:hypothetical protein